MTGVIRHDIQGAQGLSEGGLEDKRGSYPTV